MSNSTHPSIPSRREAPTPFPDLLQPPPSGISERPIIAISGELQWVVTEPGGYRWLDSSPIAYQHSVYNAGGAPILLPVISPELTESYLDIIDGLVLQGGEDVTPALYGGDEQTGAFHNQVRDDLEIALVRGARERRIPVLGICRGLQLMNVVFGGKLVQDIGHTSAHPNVPLEQQESLRHRVQIIPGSRIHSIIGSESIVNTFHHQAVLEHGGGELIVTAHADDGTVEAGEIPGDWWNIGVQWHPEKMAAQGDADAKKIFASLIEQAATFHASRQV